MKNLKLIRSSSTRTLSVYMLTAAFLATCFGLSFFSTAHAADQLTAQLDFGAQGVNVTNLQSFLASTPSIYPEGLVTGYYGSLTRAAVQRFQVTYGIVSSGTAASTGYGRVGPTTLAKINELIGGGISTGDTAGPSFFSVTQSVGQTSDTFSWITNESATARVYYSTSPVQFNEGTITSSGFGAITGQVATDDGNMRTSHSVMLTGLQPNTTYYYTLASTDASGNVSVYGPNNTFKTSQ